MTASVLEPDSSLEETCLLWKLVSLYGGEPKFLSCDAASSGMNGYDRERLRSFATAAVQSERGERLALDFASLYKIFNGGSGYVSYFKCKAYALKFSQFKRKHNHLFALINKIGSRGGINIRKLYILPKGNKHK